MKLTEQTKKELQSLFDELRLLSCFPETEEEAQELILAIKADWEE